MNQRKGKLALIFTVMLFAVYTFSALFLAVIGVDVYDKNVESSNQNYNVRTSVLYLTEKIRQNEMNGMVRLDELHSSQAIVLSQEINELIYETWVYVENGYLCEVLVPEGYEVMENTGQEIMPMAGFEFEISDEGLLNVSVLDEDGNSYNAIIFLESYENGGV